MKTTVLCGFDDKGNDKQFFRYFQKNIPEKQAIMRVWAQERRVYFWNDFSGECVRLIIVTFTVIVWERSHANNWKWRTCAVLNYWYIPQKS